MRINLMMLILYFIFTFSIMGLEDSEAKEFRIVEGLLDSDLYALSVSVLDHNLYFVGSDSTLFRSKRDLDSWQAVYTVKGERTKVNYIEVDPNNPNYIYVATSSGLIRSDDRGRTFTKIFRGQDFKQSVVHHVKVKNNMIYIGTANGLFFTKQEDIHWNKINALPEDIEVYWIEFAPNLPHTAYIATSLGVYKTEDKFKNLVRVFSTPRVEIPDSEQEILVEESEYYAFLPQVLCIDTEDNNKIYLGTSDGIFVSCDGSKNWQRRFITGLGRADIRSIYQSREEPNVLFVATDRGFFKLNLNSDTVKQFYKGLTTNDIRYAISYSDNKFLLATNKGLFTNTPIDKLDKIPAEYQKYFKYEPTIQEVRRAAIEYNDISSKKIQRWREISKKKAWLPELGIDVGKSEYDRIIYDSNEPVYDRFLRYSEDLEWDITLDWDLGDLIWSGDQTAIDVRSRLNTQLRIDILEEVNRLYFQRYRLKLELLSSPPQDKKLRLEKQLRLKELTAALDYYTGGFFSRRTRELMMAEK